jgi:hypothetical protein
VPGIHETAYPRLKASVTARDLMEISTPTPEECAFAVSLTRRETARACFVLLLKTFQRLGYFGRSEQRYQKFHRVSLLLIISRCYMVGNSWISLHFHRNFGQTIFSATHCKI